ncbi:hypothetical protein D9M72_656160 [compost metagenome]
MNSLSITGRSMLSKAMPLAYACGAGASAPRPVQLLAKSRSSVLVPAGKTQLGNSGHEEPLLAGVGDEKLARLRLRLPMTEKSRASCAIAPTPEATP